MEPRIRCKECGCIWEYSELNERGEDVFFKCLKCGESLAQPHPLLKTLDELTWVEALLPSDKIAEIPDA